MKIMKKLKKSLYALQYSHGVIWLLLSTASDPDES